MLVSLLLISECQLTRSAFVLPPCFVWTRESLGSEYLLRRGLNITFDLSIEHETSQHCHIKARHNKKPLTRFSDELPDPRI